MAGLRPPIIITRALCVNKLTEAGGRLHSVSHSRDMRDLVLFWSLNPGFAIQCLWTPGSGMKQNPDPGHISESLVTTCWVKWILKFFVNSADPNPRWKIQIRDKKKTRSRIRDKKIQIRDPGWTSRIRNTKTNKTCPFDSLLPELFDEKKQLKT